MSTFVSGLEITRTSFKQKTTSMKNKQIPAESSSSIGEKMNPGKF